MQSCFFIAVLVLQTQWLKSLQNPKMCSQGLLTINATAVFLVKNPRLRR